jgi:hypothetical protein
MGIVLQMIHSSMDLRPFGGHWPLFQFRNPIHSRYDSLNGGSARRKASATQTHTDIHALSGIRTHDLSVIAGEDGSCRRPRGYCDLPFT